MKEPSSAQSIQKPARRIRSLRLLKQLRNKRTGGQADEHGSIFSAGDSEQDINIYIEGESPFATRRPTKNFPGGTRVAPTQSQSRSQFSLLA